jgi:hypothetical protein
MEGRASPAPEVIAYRAESTSEAGKAGGAAHPVVFRIAPCASKRGRADGGIMPKR